MNVEIALFGITRDIVGSNSLHLSLPEGSTSASLLAHLKNQYPALQNISSILVAVNSEYAEESQLLNSHDEIALIPPVSGG